MASIPEQHTPEPPTRTDLTFPSADSPAGETALTVVVALDPLDEVITAWLQVKRQRSGSRHTLVVYSQALASFRAALQEAGLHLFAEPRAVARLAGVWAAERAETSPRLGRSVAAATFNQRLESISSFYRFVQKTVDQEIENPIRFTTKRPTNAYEGALPLSAEEIMPLLELIDRSTVVGKRDYALLSLGLLTGRRESELVSLRGRHLTWKRRAGRVQAHLTFARCKGGKTLRDLLDPAATAVLREYLVAVYGPDVEQLPPDAPIWVSFSKQNRGEAMSRHTLDDICKRWLHTTKTHTLRHSFAVSMEQAQAPVSEIADRLGHSNITITNRYLKQLRDPHNPFAAALQQRFGIHRSMPE